MQGLRLHHHFKIGSRPTKSVTVEPFPGGEVEAVNNDWNFLTFMGPYIVNVFF
jgi:hypothetical protein